MIADQDRFNVLFQHPLLYERPCNHLMDMETDSSWLVLMEPTISSLHFNTCYYAPIEWAISNGIHRFDPGAGGAHKIRRGFTAISNHSLHRFSDAGLSRIMQTHIDDINRLEQEQIDALNHEMPFAQHLKN